MKILIKNVKIITQNARRDILERGFIIINGSRIERVDSEDSYKIFKKNKNLKIIDVKGAVVFPGFINPHVHLGESAYHKLFKKKFTLEDYLRITDKITQTTRLIEEKRKIIADYSLLKLLQSGTTTIAGGRTFTAAKSWGVRNVSGYMLMNSFKLRAFNKNIEQKFFKEYSKIKKSTLATPAIFLHSLNKVDLKILPIIKKILDKFPDVRLFIHVAETKKQEEEIKKCIKLSSVGLLEKSGLLSDRAVLIHGNWLSENDLFLIKKRKSAVVHCLSSNLTVADRSFNLVRALKKKIFVCLATDGVVTSRTFSILDEAIKCQHHYGCLGYNLSEQKYLDLITIEPAKILSLDKKIGSVEKGKDADLVFYKKIKIKKGGQLLRSRKIFALMVAGKMKIWKGRLLEKNENKIIRDFEILSRKIEKICYENNIT